MLNDYNASIDSALYKGTFAMTDLQGTCMVVVLCIRQHLTIKDDRQRFL